MLAGGLAVLTGVVPAAHAWSGFANGTILLIIVAFLVARGVVTCGLGARIGHLAVSVFGRSTLGLSYSIFVVDAVIAPAFPEQHGPLWRLVSAGRFARRVLGSQARRAAARTAGQLPDVLGNRQPQPVLSAVADGDGCT